MTLPLSTHGTSHVGLVHHVNDDSWSVVQTHEGGVVLMVCDGMGGMGHGDEASALAVRVLTEQLEGGAGYPPERLRQAIHRADRVVREELCDQGRGLPGSTAVLVYVLDGLGHVAWVGDSRAYLIRGGTVVERTSDHKLVNELIAAGQLTEEAAKTSRLAHVVTRALGGRPPSDRSVHGAVLDHPWKLQHQDLLFLCSDGVSDLIEDHELPPLLEGRTLEEAAQAVVDLALERGGHDNITVVLGRWDGPDFVEDELATPLMPSPRDSLPPEEPSGVGAALDDPPILDERAGAERVTEEVALADTPPGVVRPPKPSPQAPASDPTEDPPVHEAAQAPSPPPAATSHAQGASVPWGRAILLGAGLLLLAVAWALTRGPS